MHETIAVIFDFDDTLAPDTTSGYLRRAGIDDLGRFWKDEVGALIRADWDPAPAYLFKMIEAWQTGRIPPITQVGLVEWGRSLPLHEGVPALFDRLRAVARQVHPRANLEFYLVSSGIGDVLRSTAIAHECTDIWASEFHYDDAGRAVFPRKVVSFTDKTRYLYQIHKGIIGPAARGRPFDVNKKLRPDQARVPMSQMIFVGDGYTDIPCFALIRKEGGVSIAVYDRNHGEKWGSAYQFVQDGRVSNLHAADYSERSDLVNFLGMAVRKMAQDIAVAGGAFQG